jgi:Ohr subfamily peroxiredoxin
MPVRLTDGGAGQSRSAGRPAGFRRATKRCPLTLSSTFPGIDIMNILYKAKATSTGGRDGRAVSSDEILDLKLAMPRELGGKGDVGTNPEQLFAAGYSACFLSALRFVGGQKKISVPADAKVTAEVGIGPNDKDGIARFALDIDLIVALPGVAPEAAHELLEAAHQACPYSNATRGNVDVRIRLA